MSALARYFNSIGKKVYGYDKANTILTEKMESEGINIYYEDDPGLLPDNIDLCVYTPAIPQNNKQIETIRGSIPLMKRSEVLGELTRNSYTIAIAGTHGKTSISAIIAHVLKSAGISFSAFVGGILKNYDTNLISSADGKIMLVEADEYDRSFLQLTPDIAVISSLDLDHLDIYGSYEEIQKAYQQFISQIKPGGSLIINSSVSIKLEDDKTITTYSAGEYADYHLEEHKAKTGKKYQIVRKSEKLGSFSFPLEGEHNTENELAAFAVADTLNIDFDNFEKAMKSFMGVKRRYDIIINDPSISYIDDYAHHPEEIKAIVTAVRNQFKGKQITGIFQPHLYSRTADFATEFAKSLELLDKIILLDIYPAREEPIEGVGSHLILDKIKNPMKVQCSKENLLHTLDKMKLEVLLTLGAGDIDTLVPEITNYLKERHIIE